MNNCIGLTKIFDIHMSVHPNIITNYRQQDATFLDLFIFTDALHVSEARHIVPSPPW